MTGSEQCDDETGQWYHTINPALLTYSDRHTAVGEAACIERATGFEQTVTAFQDDSVIADALPALKRSPVGDVFPTDCVLCGNMEETHEDHEQHMEDAH